MTRSALGGRVVLMGGASELVMLTISEMAALLRRVDYRDGWRFEIYEGRHEGPHLRISTEVPDAYSPGETVPLDIHSFLPPLRDEAAFMDWLLWRLKRIEVHECREFLRLDGKAYSDPHGPEADRDL
jgi:hypothetical protein